MAYGDLGCMGLTLRTPPKGVGRGADVAPVLTQLVKAGHQINAGFAARISGSNDVWQKFVLCIFFLRLLNYK